MRYKVNQEKCVGCLICLQTCPGATRVNNSGKVEVVSDDKIEKCGGEDICPSGAIEKIDEDEEKEKIEDNSSSVFDSGQTRESSGNFKRSRGRGPSFRQRLGKGAGSGRGFGGGWRGGRGMGHGRV